MPLHHRSVFFGLTLALALAAPLASAAEKPQGERPKPAEDTKLDVGVLGGVGFPRPFSIEPVLRVNSTVMFGAEYSFMPTINIAGVDTRLWGGAATLRWFPLKGGFFVGLRGGYQEISGQATLNAGRFGSYTDTAEVSAWYLNPRVGFLWIWKPVALGVDVGLHVPVSSSVTRSSLLALAAPEVDAQITSATNTMGRSVLPTIDLLRLGLVF